MNRIVKLIISAVVIVLTILYFLIYNNKTFNTCNSFNRIINEGIIEYFSNNKPEIDGEINTVTIEKLLEYGFVSLKEVNKMGGSCSGKAQAVNYNNSLYYYNNISCGSCSIDNLYTSWSNFTESIPSKKNMQVMGVYVYNYTLSVPRYGKWSAWLEKINFIDKNDNYNSEEIVDRNIESKNMYQYRDAIYKWYKTEGLNYYNNGEYSENSPANGYVKDEASKKVFRNTILYDTETSLKNTENLKEGDVVQKVDSYRKGNPRYIYFYTSETCSSYKPLYKCYKQNTDQEFTSLYFASSANEAISKCKSDGYVNCAVISDVTISKEVYNCTRTYQFSNSSSTVVTSNCTTAANNSIKTCNSVNVNNQKITCVVKVPRKSWIKTTSTCLVKYSYLSTPSSTQTVKESSCIPKTQSCSSESNYTSGNKKIVCPVNTRKIVYGYKGNISQKTYYDNGNMYTSCPTGYLTESTGKYSTTECEKNISDNSATKYYLKADGTVTTSESEASLLTEDEYNVLKSKNSNLSVYKKSSNIQGYDYSNSTFVEGECPSTDGYQCKTMYKGIIYTYKWYEKKDVSKSWCNNGEYSISSPDKNCIKDISTLKWSQWSEWGEQKIEKTESREVALKKLYRYRDVYFNRNSLSFNNWLDLQEFELKSGKTLEELNKDKNVYVSKRTFYKYRTLK